MPIGVRIVHRVERLTPPECNPFRRNRIVRKFAAPSCGGAGPHQLFNPSCVSTTLDELLHSSYLWPDGCLSFAAIPTNSAKDSAFILRMTCPRWIFTVISLVPSS